MFHKILVANRGEIALRVIRACRDLGVQVAVVYSEADRGAPYLDLADQAVCIGPGIATESYLKASRIIAAAEGVGADAIHPGYGFLSENAGSSSSARLPRP
jgi:acetyl-CoA carboxylase biotin carboxylase subunit